MPSLNDYFIRDFILDDLWPEATSRGLLLDLGCGAQPYGPLLESQRWRSISVDIKMDTAAEIIADATCLPFGKDTFDCIFCVEVVEHIYDYDKAVSEMARLLKPGGLLAITWPFMYGMHDIPRDYNRFTEFAMEKILRRHGLNNIKIRRRGDGLSVFLTVIGQYLCGAIDVITRKTFAGGFLRPLNIVTEKIVQFVFWSHYRLTRRSLRVKPATAGDSLRGIPGALALWTLGYCAIARKDKKICR